MCKRGRKGGRNAAGARRLVQDAAAADVDGGPHRRRTAPPHAVRRRRGHFYTVHARPPRALQLNLKRAPAAMWHTAWLPTGPSRPPALLGQRCGLMMVSASPDM